MLDKFPVNWVRQMFPALLRSTSPVFFDNAAGAQIPQKVLDAIHEHLLVRNVQRGGRYRESQEVDASIVQARRNVAAFLNTLDPEEIAFGMNATSFIRMVSLAVGQTLTGRHEIIVTDLDHEANIAAWLALERDGAIIRWWKIRDDGRLQVADLDPLLSSKTRLVACTAASNAIGTIVDVTGVAKRAHAHGAEVFLDAVQYAPHATIDVQEWGCDYLVCSGYKIFGPHMGFLWGRREALEALPTFREDFIPNSPPSKLEAGTFIYENVAGMNASIEYLAELGGTLGSESSISLRQRLLRAMDAIRAYEASVSAALLEQLNAIKGVTVHGITDPKASDTRVPTFCFSVHKRSPAAVAASLAEKGIAVRDGHMYSPRLMKRLGIPADCGAVRASLVHYNTREEVVRFVTALEEIVGS